MKKNLRRAKPFIATRNHHVSETAEDYVEIIYDIISRKGEARVCDIAKHLGVSHVTVVRTVERLRKKGLVKTEQNQPVTLTAKGTKLAKMSKERHAFLMDYLIALGVPKHIAEIDVEGMEHHVSEDTIRAFQKHLELLKGGK